MTILVLDEYREIITFNTIGFELLEWLCDLTSRGAFLVGKIYR